MRLFLSDTFYEAVLSLPKKIQSKVIAFQKKFRENNAANGIHLEPIAQFKDNALRSARVDDNYRAIIGVLGDDTYHLLYVGTHEDAYSWGMRKRFAWNEHTQSCQLITVTESEEVVSKASPDSAENAFFKDVTDEKLLAIGVPQELLGKVRSIR